MMDIVKKIKDYHPDHPIYRSFVGPPERYDIIAAMAFNLLTCLGLREFHSFIDIGCGSLRIGRIIIPYLNTNNYWGIDPNFWLIQEGVNNEIGQDMVKIKAPTLICSDSYLDLPDNSKFDFALAHSIFTHSTLTQIKEWIEFVNLRLKDNGMFLATIYFGENDYIGDEWVYPETTRFQFSTIENIVLANNLFLSPINWWHPHNQTWLLISKKRITIEKDFNWNNSAYRQL